MIEIFKITFENNYAIFATQDGSDTCTCMETNTKVFTEREEYSYDGVLVEYVANGWSEDGLE